MLQSTYPDLIIILGGRGYVGSFCADDLRSRATNSVVVTVDRAEADIQCDLTDQSIHDEVLSTAMEKSAAKSLGVVVATGFSPFTPTLDRTRAEALQTLETNLLIPMWALNALARACQASELKGTAVLISSVYGHFAPDFGIYRHLERKNSEVYGASKAGLNALTRYYAKMFSDAGVRVNAVAPGGVYDPNLHSSEFALAYGNRVATRRMVTRKQVADAVGFLLTEGASGIVGQTLAVDGGYGL